MAIVINPALFVVGQNAAMWLDKATANEVKVLGLQGMGLGIGFSQTSIDVQMMGMRIAPKVYTGATYDEMTANANYIPGDVSQTKLKAAAETGTMLKNIRMYLKDGCHFSAPDQIETGGGLTTGSSGLNVGNFGDPSIGSPSEIFTNSVSFAPGGPFTVFVAHSTPNGGADVTIAAESTTGAGATATLGTGDWASLGFEVDDIIIVDWNIAHPCYAKVEALNTNVMTLVELTGDSALLVDGTLPANGAVHGATPTDIGGLDVDC